MAASAEHTTTRNCAPERKPAVPTKDHPFVFDQERETWVCFHHGDQDSAGWVICWNGCDDDLFDEYEDDPIECEPGEMSVCPECHGKGGWNVCLICNEDRLDVEV